MNSQNNNIIEKFHSKDNFLSFDNFSGRNKILFYVLVLCLIILSATILITNSVTNEFLFQNVAFVEYSQNFDHIPNYDYSIGNGIFAFTEIGQGHVAFLIILKQICNIGPEILQYLPIGLLFFSLTYFIIIKRFCGSLFLATIMALYISFESSHLPVTFSIFAYALTFPLFLMIVYFFIYLIKVDFYKTIILTIIIFLSLNFYHYTATFWVILFIFFFMIISLMSKVNNTFLVKEKNYQKMPLFLLFMISILFLFFNKAIYKSYLPPILSGNVEIDFTLTLFIDKIQNFISGTAFNANEKYLFNTQNIPLIGPLSFFNVVLILLPIIIFLIYLLKSIMFSNEKINLDNNLIIFFSILCVGIVDVIGYTIRGNVSTKFISLIFPVIAIYSLKNVKINDKYKILYLLILFFVLFLKFFLFWQFGYMQQIPSYSELDSGTHWFYEKIKSPDFIIISDLNTYGHFLVTGSTMEVVPPLRYYDSDTYAAIVEPGMQNDVFINKLRLKDVSAYIVINNKNANLPIKSFYWKVFEPLSNYLPNLNYNRNLDKVYNDNTIFILTPKQY